MSPTQEAQDRAKKRRPNTAVNSSGDITMTAMVIIGNKVIPDAVDAHIQPYLQIKMTRKTKLQKLPD